jgi:hypothetical protein
MTLLFLKVRMSSYLWLLRWAALYKQASHSLVLTILVIEHTKDSKIEVRRGTESYIPRPVCSALQTISSKVTKEEDAFKGQCELATRRFEVKHCSPEV